MFSLVIEFQVDSYSFQHIEYFKNIASLSSKFSNFHFAFDKSYVYYSNY